MKVVKELLTGCWLLESMRFEDARGRFVKSYHEEMYAQLGVKLDIREEFYSVSHKDVIRGMHFQLPPHALDKLVYCPQGAVCDVLLDLRAGSDYGRVASAELSDKNCHLIFIPKGIAHGFRALDHESLMIYKTSTVHNPESDCGIRWDSFGFDWGVRQPCLSDRDQKHPPLASFITPF